MTIACRIYSYRRIYTESTILVVELPTRKQEGLVAADRSKVYNSQDIDAFKKSDIVKHFTWSNREAIQGVLQSGLTAG